MISESVKKIIAKARCGPRSISQKDIIKLCDSIEALEINLNAISKERLEFLQDFKEAWKMGNSKILEFANLRIDELRNKIQKLKKRTVDEII